MRMSMYPSQSREAKLNTLERAKRAYAEAKVATDPTVKESCIQRANREIKDYHKP